MLKYGVFAVKFGVDKDILIISKGQNMWLDNLRELKKETRMSVKEIADKTRLPERTVARIFSGDTPNPYVDTLYRIVAVLDGSLDAVLADSKAVVGSHNLATLQSEVDRLTAENGMLAAELAMTKDKAATLTVENDMLKMKLQLKEEIISLHNYYNSRG